VIAVGDLFSLEVVSEDVGIVTVSSFGEVFKVPRSALDITYPEPYAGQNLIQDFEWWQAAYEIQDEARDT